MAGLFSKSHVADLHLVRDAAEGDDGPVLKFKRRDDAQLLHRPGQVADDEAASGAPERFAFRQGANVAQAFGHHAAGSGRNVNANHGATSWEYILVQLPY